MGHAANSFSGWLVRAAVAALLATVSMPSIARAEQNSTQQQGSWMAVSGAEAGFSGRSWGRLILQDGELQFQSADYHWRTALSEIKRVGKSKAASRAFEVETVTGAIYVVAILDGKMLTDLPGKAIRIIERGIREAPTATRQASVVQGSK